MHSEPTRAQFATTHWSVVLTARDGQLPGAGKALEALCRLYYKPVYAFVRRQGHPPHQAQDLTQEFFSRFLEKDYLDSVDREKGRFRSFVLACLKHFLSTARVRAAALKRGGHQRFISLEECNLEEQYQATGEPDASAERTFDRKWATTVMEQALRLLRQEFTAGGKASQFEPLKKFLSADPAPGEYALLSADLSMSAGALSVAVHRMRQRYGELVRCEIGNTVTHPTEIESEVRWLIEVLTRM